MAVTSPTDCIFAQAAPFLASALNAAAAIARQARTVWLLANQGAEPATSKQQLDLLYQLLCAFHHGTALPSERLNHYLAATTMVLLNCIFPAGHRMEDPVVLDAYARAPCPVAAAMKRQHAAAARGARAAVGMALPQVATPAALAEARRFWSAFERPTAHLNAWGRLEPLLAKFLETDGSMENSLESLDEFWQANDTLLRIGAWLVASPDGKSAPEHGPLAGVRSWTQVRSEHLMPVMVGSTTPSGKHIDARAALVGVMPCGLQQILALLMAAPTIPNVLVQNVQNFGFLIFRPSAAPDILTSRSKERSAKACSVVNVEGDEASFGTREEKLRMAKAQRRAWRTNLDLVLPLCSTIATPLPDAVRARGCLKEVDYIKNLKRELDALNLHTKQEHDASALFAQAVKDSE